MGQPTPNNADEICEQPLWSNIHIKVNKICIEYSAWQNKTINYIQDIINEKGEILDKIALNVKYDNISNFLEYESLISAIQKKWKVALREKAAINVNFIIQEGCYITINNTKRKRDEIKTQDIYWQLISSISKRPTCKRKQME